MNAQDLILIERHYWNELSEAERLSFEKRVAEDAGFEAEVLLYAKAMRAIHLYGKEQMKQKLYQRPMIAPVIAPDPPVSRRFWCYVFIFIIVSLIGGWLWIEITQKPEMPYTNPDVHLDDTIQKTIDNPPARDTTAQLAPTPTNERLAKRQPDAEKLFAQYFTAYQDETLRALPDGGDSLSRYDRFLKLYRDGQYAEMLSAFEQLSDKLKKSDKPLLFKANALLATGRANEAAVLLNGIDSAPYAAHAKWYRALAALKTGNISRAKELLEQLKSDDRAPEQRQAEQLWRALQ